MAQNLQLLKRRIKTSKNISQMAKAMEMISASKIKKTTRNSDFLYIQNGPDQLYPLVGIIPSKPWATQFPWYMELDNIQNKIIKRMKDEQVKFVLSRNYNQGGKYDLGTYKPDALVSFIDKNYKPYVQISSDLILKKINEN